MSLPTLTDEPILRGNSFRVSYTLDLEDGTDVTAVSSIVGVAEDTAGNEADIPVVMAQVGSTNVWTGKFMPVWDETSESTKRQRWVVRVSGMVADESFEDAGHLVIVNHR